MLCLLHAVESAFDCVAAVIGRADRLRVDHRTLRRGEARVDGVFIDAGAAVLRDGADDEERLVLAARGIIRRGAGGVAVAAAGWCGVGRWYGRRRLVVGVEVRKVDATMQHERAVKF